MAFKEAGQVRTIDDVKERWLSVERGRAGRLTGLGVVGKAVGQGLVMRTFLCIQWTGIEVQKIRLAQKYSICAVVVGGWGMRVEVQSEFSKGFFIDEEALKKIDEIIRNRIGGQEGFAIAFSVSRIDFAKIEYDSINDLLENEDNSRIAQVSKLEIQAGSDRSNLTLVFEKGKKTRFNIESDIRDSAILLSADLKEYLKGEVLIRRLAFLNRFANDKVAYPMSYLFGMIIPAFMTVYYSNKRETVLPSATLEQKVDFLVNSTISKYSIDNYMKYVAGYLIIATILIVVAGSDRFFPTHTFYWGKEIQRYESSKSVRDRIFWGVLVALVIGVAGSLLAGKIQVN